MKKFLFLMLSAAVAVSASAGINGAKISKKVAKIEGKSKTEQVARVAKSGVVATPAPKFRAPAKVDIPAGMVAVTLTAGDVWQDGSGYQMLLDADATAYGTIIPETGGLTTGGDATAETYAEFEYKIPENADGAMTTQNIVLNNSITIVIPAGTYDWCITNPTPGDRIWIASSNGIGGRYDDFEFLEGYSYEFTMTLDDEGHDVTTLTLIDPNGNEVLAPATPELTVNPAANSATVTWAADENATGWNLIWRPFVDTSGNPIDCDLNGTEEEIDADMAGWQILDNDGDGNTWGIITTESGSTDYFFYSQSYKSGAALTPDNYLISPVCKLQGVLEFDVFDYGYAETMRPYVMTSDMTSIEEAIPLGDEDIVTPGAQMEKVHYSFDLSEYEGQMGSILFRHYNCTDGFYLFLDNIFIGDHNATIVEPYEWTLVQGLTTPEYTIEGLTPETTYEVAVQGYNQFYTSDEIGYTTFVTLAEQAGILGDVNKDGNVLIDDLTALIDALLGGVELEETDTYSPDNANVNGDETVSIADVTALIDMLLSK